MGKSRSNRAMAVFILSFKLEISSVLCDSAKVDFKVSKNKYRVSRCLLFSKSFKQYLRIPWHTI